MPGFLCRLWGFAFSMFAGQKGACRISRLLPCPDKQEVWQGVGSGFEIWRHKKGGMNELQKLRSETEQF